jgi:hypothetical protein
MPLEVSIYGSRNQKPEIKRVQVNEKTNTFIFPVDFEPEKLVLDSNFLVFMEASFTKK